MFIDLFTYFFYIAKFSIFSDVDIEEDMDENINGGIEYFPSIKQIKSVATPDAQEYEQCHKKCDISYDKNCSMPSWLNHLTIGVDITKYDNFL